MATVLEPAMDSAAAGKMTDGRSVWRAALRLRRTQVGLALTSLILAMVVLGPEVAPFQPNTPVAAPYAHASGRVLLGADTLGRDVLSRVLWGGWSVVWMACAATAIGFAIGVPVGLVAGYARTWADDAITGGMDVILAFPPIVMALLFVSMLGPKLWLITLIVGIAYAPRIARLTRSVTLELVHREFIEVAELIGVPRWQILGREVLPNLATPLLVEFTTRLTWAIAIIAGISFVGYGIQPPNANWGLMINENRIGLVVQPWAVLAPVACIAIFAIGTNLVGDGLARALADDGPSREQANT
jgi:peptide/nickel transport system permease protein